MRLRLAEKTLEEDLGRAIDDLNAQIRTNREALNADLPTIDRRAALNEAKDKLARQSLDRSALEDANRSIENFDTNVQLQLKSRELGAENIYNVMQDFQDSMETHKDNMQVMAKVQILEEYRNLIDEFVKSIERQNEAYEQQTRTAALSAGYVEMGQVFIKKGQGSTNLGVVASAPGIHAFADTCPSVDIVPSATMTSIAKRTASKKPARSMPRRISSTA